MTGVWLFCDTCDVVIADGNVVPADHPAGHVGIAISADSREEAIDARRVFLGREPYDPQRWGDKKNRHIR